ncbi:uncharacterized protein PGTG_10046 [Puccinia graminis f. sp. tritici CRL 75-36-700-3]|uniref:BAG domain-containing protein n=1 Tax=Puccinia graminis f. sp. tritici (strain CRL 75-36-700-3 / race SCCL) TaxID=418459 RepID=E3KJ51_PUCGT|nr:uncharacterized protein PGTG_10046 [Puccinia graminis f. sp. tritici CRL 75-36-700-3]EFP84326.1 hypothetical protein PGTG_10046 [Puccinia graminis f. sp. tritici CRL 75-36-700-3]
MEVIWDSERFSVDLPVSSFTLGSFKRYLASRTGVPAEHMKLFCNAGLMKDDSAPLSAFQPEVDSPLDPGAQSSSPLTRSRLWSGIFSGTKKRQISPMRIRMVGAKETRSIVSDRPDLKPTTAPSNQNLKPQAGSNPEIMNESRIISLINELTQKALSDNLPRVERYEGMIPTERGSDEVPVDRPLNPQNTQPVQAQWDPTEFAGVSEVLLQALLKLDGFEIESEWTEARMARKEGVRAVQKLLDRLDRVKGATGPQR